MIKVSSVVVVLVLSALADSQKLVDFMGPLHLELHQNDCNGKAAICAGTLAYRKCVPNADGEMVPYGLFIPCPVNTTCLNSENICVPNTTELSDDLSNEKLTATTAEVLTVSNANVNESKNNDIDTTEKMVNDSSVDTVTTNDFTNNDNSNYTADAKVTESTKKVSDNAENSVVFYDNADLNNEETKEVNHKLVESSVFIDEMVNDSNDSATVLRTNDSTIINLNKSEGSDVSGVTADMTTKDTTTNNKGVEPSVQSVEMPNHSSGSVSAASTYDAASVNVGAESLYVSDVTADLTQEENAANEKSVEPPVHTEEIINDAPDPVSTAITDNAAKVNNGVQSLGDAANVNIDAGSFDESDATSDFTQKETAATEKSVKPSVHTEIKVNDTLDPVSTATTDNAAKVNNDVESLGVSNVTAGLSQEENVVNEKSVEPSVHTEEMVIDTHDSVFAVSTDDTANVNIGAENLDLSDVTADWTQEKNVANEKNDESSVHTEEMVDDTPDSVSAATTGDAAKVNNGAGSLDVSDVTADLIQEENVDNENNVEPLVHTEEMVNDTPNSVSAASADGAANVNIGAESLDVSDTTADWTQEKNVANEKNDESSVNTEEMADDAPDSISANGDAANVNIGAGSLDESDATSDFTQEETAATEKSVEPSVHTEEMIDDTPDPVSTATTGDTAKVNNGAGSLNASDVTADLTQEENVDNENSVESSIHIEEIVNGTPDSVSAASADDAANVNIGAESLDVSDITADWTQEKNVANEKNDESSVRTEEMVNDTPDSISANDGAANVNIDAGSFDESDATSDFTQEEPAATEKSVEPSVHTEQMVSDTPDSVSATNTDDTANVNIGTGSLDVSDIVAGWTQEENVANEKNDESSVHTEEMVDDTPDSISANGDAANVNIGAGSLDESDATSNFTQEDTAANEKYVELSGHTVEIVNDSSESVHLENTNNSANVNPDKPGDSDVSDITVDLTQEEFVTNKYNVEPSVHTEEMVAYSTNYFSEVSTDNTATVNFGAGVSDLHDVSVDLTHDEIAPNYTVEPSNEMVNESTECVNVVNTNDSANVNLASRDSYVSDATHVTQEKTAANENSVELYVHAEDMANDFTDTADSTNDAAYDYHDGMVKLDKSSPTTDLTDAETSANNKEVEMTVSTDDDSNNSVDVAKTNLNIGNTKDSVAYGVISDLIEEENASNKESMEPSTSTKEMVNDLIKNVAGSNAQDSSYEESDFTKKLDISNLTTNSTNDESNKHFAPFSTVKEVLSDSAMDISKSYSKNANSTNEPDDSIYEGSLQNKKHLEQRFITSETTKSENTLPNSEESDEELTDSGIVKVSKTVEVNKNINVMNWQNMYYQYYWKALGDHYKRLGMYFREREQQRRKEMQEEPQKLFEHRSKLAKGMMRTIKEIECKYEEIDNVYPDMKNCKKYYRCINKSNELKLVHLRCDNHKEFDWISLKCVYRYKAFCLGRNRY